MLTATDRSLDSLLSKLSEEIDVPESKYEEAKRHYTAVGEWLGAEGSALAPFGVSVFPQGSFALGTAVKPGEGCDYDVDAVCLLARPPTSWSQEQMKLQVGNRLREHGTYSRMLKPPEGRRRCWTLVYADGSQFHLDVLPAKPDDCRWLLDLGVPRQYAELGIQITCRDCYGDLNWPKSNPGGYLRWFVDRMRVQFDEARKRVALAKSAEVHRVPEYAVRTPLQRVVQILKRQRDVMYGDDPDRPISIIITTLAARAYDNESDLVTAYQNVALGMRDHIQEVNGRNLILNPVNPKENFADRWESHPQRRDRFFEWLGVVEETARQLVSNEAFESKAALLNEQFGPGGARAAQAAAATSGTPTGSTLSEAVSLSEGLPAVLAVSHRAVPPWPMRPAYRATVSARASRTGFRTVTFSDRSASPPLAKGMDLWFTLMTDTPAPYEAYWQVVNTGDEAARDRGLRGGFDTGETRHYETTRYRGRHAIQAFIVKDGRCVAQSRPVFVVIR